MGKTYQNSQHLSYLYNKLQDFLVDDDFTDVKVETADCIFPVHRVILAASSPFWLAMFKGGFIEQDKDEVKISNVSTRAFKEILVYIYKGVIDINTDTVQCIYEAADFLQYTYIKECCIQFMKEDICSTSWVQYYQIADKFSLLDVKEQVKCMILSEFESVSISSHFYELPLEFLCELLLSNHLNCSEKTVFDVITKYLKKNEPLMPEQVNKLVDTLRYGLLDIEHLEELCSLEPFIGMQSVFAINHSITKYDRGGFMQPFLFSPYFRPRCCPKLLILGGSNGNINLPVDGYNVISSVNITRSNRHCSPYSFGSFGLNSEIYCLTKDESKQRFLPEALHSFTAVCVSNFVFVMGGEQGNGIVSPNAYRYDILRNVWLVLTKMPVSLKGHTAAHCEQKIISVGGEEFHTKGILNSVFEYDIVHDKWIQKNQYPNALMRAAACTNNCGGGDNVYVSGGRSALENYHDSIYQYESDRDGWALKGNLSTAVFGHSMSYFNDKLYVAGGLGVTREPRDGSFMKQMQCFDLNTLQCSVLKPIADGVTFASSVALNGRVYLVGGFVRSERRNYLRPVEITATDTILVYDIESDTWMKETEFKLPYRVNGHCCVTAFT